MLTQRLEGCVDFINIDPKERPVFTTHYDIVRNWVINRMKSSDELFRKIYRRYQLSGSYADQLKVSKPNEYDVLMILDLRYPITELKTDERKPGYVQIQYDLKNPPKWEMVVLEELLTATDI